MTKEQLERKLNDEVKRVCTEAARAAVNKGMGADEMKHAATKAASEAADEVIRRFMHEHNVDSVVTVDLGVNIEVGPRKVVEFEHDPKTHEAVRAIVRTIL